MGVNSHANDAMIRRLEKELEERNAFVQGLIANAQDAERDLNETEQASLAEARNRMGDLKKQIDQLEEMANVAQDIATRAKQVDQAISTARKKYNAGEVEYRSVGSYVVDSWRASLGDREAKDRLEVFHRTAAHQKTGDNAGVIPDPIVGNVINFIDAARPLVSFVGPQPMEAATWYRPHVTQHTSVQTQGSAGAAVDEKTELVSQKMTIERISANAVTYGGYVNVSRQNIDFSQPQIMDLIINDLAAQYAIETEAAFADELAQSATSPVTFSLNANDVAGAVHAAVWDATSQVYAAVKGQGRLVLAVSPDMLKLFGPLFAPVNPRDAASPGLTAGQFGQGVMGSIGGVPVIMSAGLGSGESFLFSTAAIEAFEQRVGTLQATEPSVLGVQVAYAGYFTPLTIEEDAIVPIEATTAT